MQQMATHKLHFESRAPWHINNRRARAKCQWNGLVGSTLIGGTGQVYGALQAQSTLMKWFEQIKITTIELHSLWMQTTPWCHPVAANTGEMCSLVVRKPTEDSFRALGRLCQHAQAESTTKRFNRLQLVANHWTLAHTHTVTALAPIHNHH